MTNSVELAVRTSDAIYEQLGGLTVGVDEDLGQRRTDILGAASLLNCLAPAAS